MRHSAVLSRALPGPSRARAPRRRMGPWRVNQVPARRARRSPARRLRAGCRAASCPRWSSALGCSRSSAPTLPCAFAGRRARGRSKRHRRSRQRPCRRRGTRPEPIEARYRRPTRRRFRRPSRSGRSSSTSARRIPTRADRLLQDRQGPRAGLRRRERFREQLGDVDGPDRAARILGRRVEPVLEHRHAERALRRDGLGPRRERTLTYFKGEGPS